MMMTINLINAYKKRLLLLVISTMIVGCTNKKCTNIDNIEISSLLISVYKEKNVPYCKLIEGCLKNDKDALVKFSLLDINDAASYDHGAIMVQIIQKIGEDSYISAIQNVSEKDRENIRAYIDVGIEYGGLEGTNGKQIEQMFPKLSSILPK